MTVPEPTSKHLHGEVAGDRCAGQLAGGNLFMKSKAGRFQEDRKCG